MTIPAYPVPNSAQVVFALAMAVWVVDVGFAPKPAPAQVTSEGASCQSGPSAVAPAGTDLELVVCVPHRK